jgi:hypothetical protein
MNQSTNSRLALRPVAISGRRPEVCSPPVTKQSRQSWRRPRMHRRHAAWSFRASQVFTSLVAPGLVTARLLSIGQAATSRPATAVPGVPRTQALTTDRDAARDVCRGRAPPRPGCT